MATFNALLVPTSPTAATLINGTVANNASTTITLNYRQPFAITCNGNIYIRFGNVTKVPTAAATDWPIWAGAVQQWDTGEEMDRFSIYNASGATVTYWVYCTSQK